MIKLKKKRQRKIISEIICILLFAPCFVNAQPAPCMGESVIIINGISNVNKNDIKIYLRQINQRDTSSYKRYIRPIIWTECINSKGDIDTKHLNLNPPEVLIGHCNNHIFKSASSEKFYLIGYNTNDAVLVIESNHKIMYLVFPTGNANKINRYLLGSIYKDFQGDNFKDKNGFYSPNMYLPNIKFKEGIFFLEDYQLFNGQEKTISFPAKDVVEFHHPGNRMRANPLEYWKDSVRFFAPYNSRKSVICSKKIKGKFTEKEAIETIIKKGTNHTLEIFDYFHWEKYTKNHENSDADIELNAFINEAKRTHERDVKDLVKLFEENKNSKKNLYKRYEVLEKNHLMLILENDFELMVLFCNYLQNTKTNIQDFLLLFEDKTYTIKKKQLALFLKQKNKDFK
jgi:hypothetical protein